MGIVDQLLTFNIEDEDGNQFFPDLTITAADIIARLEGYAAHFMTCNLASHRGAAECTCGLSALLEEIDRD